MRPHIQVCSTRTYIASMQYQACSILSSRRTQTVANEDTYVVVCSMRTHTVAMHYENTYIVVCSMRTHTVACSMRTPKQLHAVCGHIQQLCIMRTPKQLHVVCGHIQQLCIMRTHTTVGACSCGHIYRYAVRGWEHILQEEHADEDTNKVERSMSMRTHVHVPCRLCQPPRTASTTGRSTRAVWVWGHMYMFLVGYASLLEQLLLLAVAPEHTYSSV
jgi:hypothetical protein